MHSRLIPALLLCTLCVPLFAAEPPPASTGGKTAWWWDESFWSDGQIPAPTNHAVETRWIAYKSGDNEVPALLARPRDGKKYPGVLFMHGRRGLDDLIQLQVKRLAARGFVVLAPDVFKAHFIAPMPIEHDFGKCAPSHWSCSQKVWASCLG